MSATPPPPMTPEFLAEDQRPAARIAISFVTAIALAVVAVRVWVRHRMMGEFGWDDGFICAATIINIVVMALTFQVLKYGAGKHIYALDPEGDLVPMYQWLLSAQLTYMVALYLCRVSGLAFYARLNQIPRFRLWLKLSLAFITAVFIAQILLIALQCIPLATLWGGAKGKCLGSNVIFISTAAMTIVCDSIILLLPMSIVLTVQAGLRRKIALTVVLCFGLFAVITSVFRIIAMIPASTKEDATWYFSVVMIWSDVEVSTAIVALSLPALRGLFGLLRGEGASRNGGSGANSGGGGGGSSKLSEGGRYRRTADESSHGTDGSRSGTGISDYELGGAKSRGSDDTAAAAAAFAPYGRHAVAAAATTSDEALWRQHKAQQGGVGVAISSPGIKEWESGNAVRVHVQPGSGDDAPGSRTRRG